MKTPPKDFKILQYRAKNNIAILSINRSEALNALNSLFFIEMGIFLDFLENNDSIKVLIITGAGKAFAAGADIKEMVTLDSKQALKLSQNGQNVFNRIEELSIPVIAAVNGYALGGGCELAMACDIRIASTYAKFGQPEVSLGLIPGYAGTQRLPRLVGLSDALYLLLTGETISAEEAFRIRLVQKVVEPEKLIETALKTAETIASKGPMAVKKCKLASRKGWVSDFYSGCEKEALLFCSLFGNEGTEGMKAFLEKRKPNW